MHCLTNSHVPVLLDKIIEIIQISFRPAINLTVFDGTFGGGGYTSRFLTLGWQVFACDLDPLVKNYLPGDKSGHFHFEQVDFADYILTFPDNFFDVIVLDLGFSSNQLAYSQRGFSYFNSEEILDLRYNTQTGLSAWEKIRSLPSSRDLQKILYAYSGESLSARLADPLYNLAKNYPNLTVGQVVGELVRFIPKKFIRHKPAIFSRVWQALRIWVNDEFGSLERFLSQAPAKLKPQGLLMIVCFHSLEDKMVTKFMRNLAQPKEIDEFGNKKRFFQLLTSKAITPDQTEISQNSRSRSAGLRVLQKLA
jgi:16S rRNA (cytosine1402-N4)-methyltransferase